MSGQHSEGPPDSSQAANRGGAFFLGAFPLRAVIWLVVAAAVGSGMAYWGTMTQPQARCGGEPMSPGDFCQGSGRRGFANSNNYEGALANSERFHTAAQWIGIYLVAMAVVCLIWMVLRWRLDVQLRHELDDDVASAASSHSATGKLNAVCLFLSAFLLWLSLGFALQGFATSETPFLIGAAVAGAAALWMFTLALPRPGVLVLTFPDHVVVGYRKRYDVDWSEVRYYVVNSRNYTDVRMIIVGTKIPVGDASGIELLLNTLKRCATRKG